MEYYIYTTYKCNLKCSYCSSNKILNKDSIILDENKIQNTINYIEKNRNGSNDEIIFFGGEPFLEYKNVEKFIDLSSHLKINYSIYTNGLILDKIPIELLSRFKSIFISIDGDKSTHEKHRGRGTYDKIINNLLHLRKITSSILLGRITVEEETNIYDSVINLEPFFNAIYWQIVNKPSFKKPIDFIESYNRNIDRLFKHWFTNFEKGKILNFIPFQTVIAHHIYNHDNNGLSFRCGAGNKLKIIDLDGNVFWCDEYIGGDNGMIGDIQHGTKSSIQLSHKDIFSDCENCKYTDLCLGRCRKCLLEYNHEHIRNYCKMTIHLMNLIEHKLPIIKEIIKKEKITMEELYPTPKNTEEIP